MVKMLKGTARGARNLLPLYRDQSGATAIIAAILIIPLLIFMAVAIDLGVLRYEKRKMQTVADAAAIAGALELPYNDVTTGATNAASDNGFTTGSNGATLTVIYPPAAGGLHAGRSDCVEAIASRSGRTFFANIFGMNSMTARARAVACQSSSGNCIYVLDPSASGALTVTGSGSGGSLNAKCGVFVDSNSSSALTVTGSGSGGDLTATSIGVVGGVSDTGSGFWRHNHPYP